MYENQSENEIVLMYFQDYLSHCDITRKHAFEALLYCSSNWTPRLFKKLYNDAAKISVNFMHVQIAAHEFNSNLNFIELQISHFILLNYKFALQLLAQS